ncbi:isoprenylcysteine carboxylmethyltransferase family protein [Alteromonas sediminis]|uniref:Isoprenylcysteine carboxylmethyltransferase family protein n=1 Tax=Alteromonas sediminis TaxID=2259342 RepID=A0A3N5Y839_9ALTE|nr:isoprenylcysteine carboxylmethyltransferase family protein [Alteromonas sediminis]RPJ67099.1 isoprenylcysteine carboxylmethyltransferase family protein [Alteromonas sediminis]
MDSEFAIEFTRIFLACFYTFVAAFYIVRLSRKSTDGKNLVFSGEKYSATWWNHLLFRWFRVAIWAACLIRVFFPSFDQFLGVLQVLHHWPLIVLGNVLLIAGFVATVLVHKSMGHLWRSGIDPQGPSNLKTDSYFQFSRNPMFVSVALAQLGFFLAFPSVFSLICLLLGWAALHRQILAEEQHLSAHFRYQYQNYRKRVPRWL